MRTTTGVSLTEDVYGELRDALLHGRLAPGSKIHLGSLAAERGVSLGVVREAVTRLASERLVDAVLQSGFRVRSISVDQLRDLVDARCAIEKLVVTDSVRHGDTRWEAALIGAHHVLKNTALSTADGYNPAWMNAHRAFHEALAAACPNATLRNVRSQLFDEGELYRTWSSPRGNKRNIGAEHDDLVSAAMAHDADRAGQLIVAHLRHTARLAERFAARVAPSDR